MWTPALGARSIGVMQQAALAASMVYKYLYATEQHFAHRPKRRHSVKSVAYTFRAINLLIIFYELDFWLGALNMPRVL